MQIISVDVNKVSRDDPNESSAVYLLTSDDKHAVCETDFTPNQLLYRKYLALFFFVEETFDHILGKIVCAFWLVKNLRFIVPVNS